VLFGGILFQTSFRAARQFSIGFVSYITRRLGAHALDNFEGVALGCGFPHSRAFRYRSSGLCLDSYGQTEGKRIPALIHSASPFLLCCDATSGHVYFQGFDNLLTGEWCGGW
jgi:hypothetical protein